MSRLKKLFVICPKHSDIIALSKALFRFRILTRILGTSILFYGKGNDLEMCNFRNSYMFGINENVTTSTKPVSFLPKSGIASSSLLLSICLNIDFLLSKGPQSNRLSPGACHLVLGIGIARRCDDIRCKASWTAGPRPRRGFDWDWLLPIKIK